MVNVITDRSTGRVVDTVRNAGEYMRVMDLQTHLHFLPSVYAAIVDQVLVATGETVTSEEATRGEGGVEAGQSAGGLRLG